MFIHDISADFGAVLNLLVGDVLLGAKITRELRNMQMDPLDSPNSILLELRTVTPSKETQVSPWMRTIMSLSSLRRCTSISLMYVREERASTLRSRVAVATTYRGPELSPGKHLVETQTFIPNTRGWGRSRRPNVKSAQSTTPFVNGYVALFLPASRGRGTLPKTGCDARTWRQRRTRQEADRS